MIDNRSERSHRLPSSWQLATLPDIARINPRLDRVIPESAEVNFVPMKAVAPEGGGLVDPEKRSYSEVKKGYTPFLSGDVISAKITPCMENGKTTVVPELPGKVCFGSTEFHVLRPETGIDARWINYFIGRSDTRKLARMLMSGSAGQLRVPQLFLESLKIPIAPSEEQVRIADKLDELFSDLDAGVEALKRVREKLTLYRASVLKAAVEGKLTETWRMHNPDVEPASQLLKRILAERRKRWEEDQLRKFEVAGKQPPKEWKAKYKEPMVADASNLPNLPSGWCWVRAESVCHFITKGTTPPGRDAPKSSGDVPFIKVQHLTDTGSLCFSESPSFVSVSTHKKYLSRSIVFPGDVLINIVGPPLGQVSIVPTDFEEWNVNQAIAIFRPLGGLSNRLLALWLSSRLILGPALKRTKTTAGQVNLTLEICRDIALPLPPLAEQEAIVGILEFQLSIIKHLDTVVDLRIASSQSVKQSALSRAFAGKLVNQDPCDEPALELLSRILAGRETHENELKNRVKVSR